MQTARYNPGIYMYGDADLAGMLVSKERESGKGYEKPGTWFSFFLTFSVQRSLVH